MNGNASLLHAFTGHADGANPTVPLSFGTNGTIHGSTSGGGKGSGVAFALTAPN
jgi:hypothetical protein